MKISEVIKNRIVANKASFNCNDNIADYIRPGELGLLRIEVECRVEELLQNLIIDTAGDHNTTGTARRVSRMFIDEIFSGRYYESPKITSFPNAKKYNGVYVTGPITIRSTCAHHFQEISGKAYIGLYPGIEVIGLSKFNRTVDWIASRPQIQEEMTQQIANAIEKDTRADGVAVLVEASHSCVTQRGVKEHENNFQTAVMRGVFLEDKSLKQEFYNLLQLRR